MKLRLYHHPDGARVAYREAGTGPALILLHSLGLSHREWEPAVEYLVHRYRVVLPDLPLHGDSEDRPRHPYTPEWLTEVIGAFCRETGGRHPFLAGHDLGAELALRATATRQVTPAKLVLMPSRLHGDWPHPARRRAWRAVTSAAALPGLDRALAQAARAWFRPSTGLRLTARGNPEARDLVRHALMDVGGNGNRARSWARFARRWPVAAQHQHLEAYGALDLPVLLLWADADERHPIAIAEEALERLPDGQLRVLSGSGFLIAYDDPVGVARELAAFCG